MIARLCLVALLCVAAAPALSQSPPRVSTAFTLDTGHPRAPEQLAVRFDKADLAIRVLAETKSLEAVATLDFTATEPVAALVVELDTRFDVSAVTIDGAEVTGWTNPEGRMTVPLPAALSPGQSVSLRIAYSGAPHEALRAPWDGGFVWRTAPSRQPWIATAVQGQGCDLFWPCIDHPQGEPQRMDLHITVPEGLSAPSNGRLVGRTDNGDGTTTWSWTARQPNTYAVALNVGPYVEMTGTYESRFGNSIPLHFWRLETDDPMQAADLFAEFSKLLDFYEATIGPFPFADEKMGVVVTPHLGMEHQTINAYGNGYRLDGKGYDWLLQHELAHEWFGNQITNTDWDHMWLHEGFGTYMQPLYARWLNGDRAMASELQTMRLTVANKFPVVSGQSRTSGEVYEGARGPGLDLYYKGALVAHTLRLMIGDEAFYDSLRQLVYGRTDPAPGNFQPRYASTDDYVAIVNQVTGRDLGWFFHAYLRQAELPDLVQTREGGRLSLEWKTGDDGPFPMPIEVEVDGALTVVPMTDGRGEIAVPGRAHVLIDPANKVLRRQPHIEAYQAWRARNAG
ncbi:M1 family peptidase [Brevundimonas sp. S30B]|uniref:M1 family metallopeptidase n=1 Tax=unclassified Brevundimonas TaxID=2622653 RepID=UPI0010725A18|nr:MULTISPECIES: M1 family metallopeptidase [unclassified Brevundimonas]QBX37310.1 M1 family peptidase [Brevundimonas sp. MF30-B]TFW03897.1 M1 family peptidase [Brevundimonas sp. S30B]